MDIGLDFVEALLRVRGKSVILTVVDRFSKYCHFIPLGHPYSAESVAQTFFTDIVRLHGVPQSMVSDPDPVFTSTFWRELMWLMGTKLHMTTAFHLQPDGQTEAANRVIVMYLRSHWRSASPVATLAALGGVHLQHRLPDVVARHSVPRRLRARPADHPLL